ncbi:MAG TPA: dicarboxylate/amino acid:cation symporter [Methylophilaceae bacterium]|nr:dicarboxylate/amino acid:cation symporter [Methylophilaceae bacterium]
MKMPSLNIQILLAAVFGIGVGLYFHSLGQDSQVTQGGLYISGIVGSIFIDLLKMILVPLVFTSIAVGVANLQEHKQARKVWTTTLIFFTISTSVAIILGLTASNVFEPGQGLHLSMFQDSMQNFQAKQLSLPDFVTQFMHNLFQNPFSALAKGDVLAVVIFGLFTGIALVVGGARYRNILVLLQEFLDLIMLIVGWIMVLAPLGIFALLIKLVATQDVTLLASLGKFVAVVAGTTLLHGAVVLPLMLYVVTRKTPLWFWRNARESLITAFATSSSSATLPVTMRCTITNMKVPPSIAGFVVPLGATVNMDGTALYEAAAALFIAHLAGVELNMVQQLIVFFTAMLAAIGAPGIPSAGMVTMVMVLQSVGLPAEAIAILLPIDRMLDTLRTSVNVEGDMIGSLIVQKVVGDK